VSLPESPAERRARLRKNPRWRGAVGNAAKRMGLRVLQDKTSLDAKVAEASQMQGEQFGLPLNLRDAQGHHNLDGGHLIKNASADDVHKYSRAAGKTCGTCEKFELKRGQHEIVKQRFLERLVLEQEWQLKHIGAPIDHIGICGESGGEMATTTVSAASDCAGYKPRKTVFRRR